MGFLRHVLHSQLPRPYLQLPFRYPYQNPRPLTKPLRWISSASDGAFQVAKEATGLITRFRSLSALPPRVQGTFDTPNFHSIQPLIMRGGNSSLKASPTLSPPQHTAAIPSPQNVLENKDSHSFPSLRRRKRTLLGDSESYGPGPSTKLVTVDITAEAKGKQKASVVDILEN